MNMPDGDDRWQGVLPRLPTAVRVTLSAFLAMIGAGYLSAVANIYHSHRMADGKEGMSVDDIRAVYSGLSVVRAKETDIPSRMLTMIRGAMREYVTTDEDFNILESWLKRGGRQEALDEGERRKTPRRALMRNCLRCHGVSTGTEISRKSPFGPDDFEVDYGMLSKFVAASTESSGETVNLAPQYTMARLVLVSHVHMLAIPMFTLIVALLFMMTRLPWGLRSYLTPIPMIALAMDFAGWWVSRGAASFVWVILAAGAIFGLVFGIQLFAVAIDLWRPASGRSAAEK